MATESDPNIAHGLGLKAVLSNSPDRFKIARDYYDEAREGFLAEGALIDVGRVDRDLVRVYAGLGDRALRNMSLASATEIHWEAFSNPKVESEEAEELAANEYAATLHVGSRVILAEYVEGQKPEFERMAKNWRLAHSTLNSLETPNKEYLQQVVVHGGLAIATFGRGQDLIIAEDLYQDKIVYEMTDPKRIAAMEAIGKILLPRLLFRLPLKLVPKIRTNVIDIVAGPYISRYQID